MNNNTPNKKSMSDWIVIYVLASLILTLIFRWYDYVLFQATISFFQFFIFAAIMIVLAHIFPTTTKMISGTIMTIVLILQVMAWIGMITLPLAHYFK